MHKEDVVHIYNGILLSHEKNEIMSFATTWIDLEMIIPSEVSQTEKDRYNITYEYESNKNVTKELLK